MSIFELTSNPAVYQTAQARVDGCKAPVRKLSLSMAA
jgi:hypothetical protein